MKLVIVESPTKSKTIEKILGSDYRCLASLGHVRDLPKSKLGIDLENDFEPQYVIPTKARKTVNQLKKEVASADQVILAVDEDREGEAIAWHLAQALNLKDFERITFHEITPEAIKEALKNPRDIDLNLVNSQQARRILDRLVGYQLSPFLWKKVMRGLSAGRVQSVAVHLIVEREKEIEAFKPQEYWTVKTVLEKDKKTFEATLVKIKNKKIDQLGLDKEKARQAAQQLKKSEPIIAQLQQKETRRHPSPPFTTSTLQQEAGRRLNLSSRQTMRLAQNLYEKGYITYHRTDSLNMAESALKQAEDYLKKEIGPDYWPGQPRFYRNQDKLAQQAHEAIRPTDIWQHPDRINLTPPALNLYRLIWQRTLASQMSSAVLIKTSAEIVAGDYSLKANGQIIKFDGFLKIYPSALKENPLPDLKAKDKLTVKKTLAEQHFTQPPARYSEPALVKALENLGIGRPSTYAPIISTIQERGYVQKNPEKRLQPTEIGRIVDELLSQHFPEIVDVRFTAKMEEELDLIAQAKKKWPEVIKSFYQPFSKNLEDKYQSVEKKDLTEKTDRLCPECQSPLIIRMGRYGKFYGCSNFPKCRFTEPFKNNKTGVHCPECQTGEIVEKKSRRGIFYACNRYPDCRFALSDKPTGEKCPECSALLVKNKEGKIKCSQKNCHFQKD
ncbi:MAG TPA: type I DNA topoisomerase [Candidatus Pacearchaeota archaeon]|nr:type I DNA topoisomerase [Candidatus Pacearchaeota archaeon]